MGYMSGWDVPIPGWLFLLFALMPWGVYLAGVIGMQATCVDGATQQAGGDTLGEQSVARRHLGGGGGASA